MGSGGGEVSLHPPCCLCACKSQAAGVMLLDPATVANLELLRNLRTGDPKASAHRCRACFVNVANDSPLPTLLIAPLSSACVRSQSSLFGVLNHTLTPGGSRYLRATLLQPSTDLATICARLDAVTELLGRDGMLEVCTTIRTVLAHLPTGRVLSVTWTRRLPGTLRTCERCFQRLQSRTRSYGTLCRLPPSPVALVHG